MELHIVSASMFVAHRMMQVPEYNVHIRTDFLPQKNDKPQLILAKANVKMKACLRFNALTKQKNNATLFSCHLESPWCQIFLPVHERSIIIMYKKWSNGRNPKYK